MAKGFNWEKLNKKRKINTKGYKQITRKRYRELTELDLAWLIFKNKSEETKQLEVSR